MNRTFFLILIGVFVFVGINTIFYITIFNQQLEFQTDLLSQQTMVCGNMIEQEGFLFENELNSIPYQNDFTRLFTDEKIKQQGSVHLQQVYTGYSELINKITVYDNRSNVYSLILDYQDNFVSDYYESQRQIPLKERDELIGSGDKFLLTIPGFDDTGQVHSNILVDLNFNRFVASIFDRYSLENVLWQTLISKDGELISSTESRINMPDKDLKHIGQDISEEMEGSYVHTILIDSIPTRVVSVYYPIRLVKRDMGIVFSMKTDLFLHSIVTKIILISVCSLILLILLLYIHFRVINNKLEQHHNQKFSYDTIKKTFDILPIGLVFINPDGKTRLINKTATDILEIDDAGKSITYDELGLEKSSISVDDSIYNRTFGKGTLFYVRKESSLKHIYSLEWQEELAGEKIRMILLIDVSIIESARNLDRITLLSKAELLESMGQEISVPLGKIRDTIAELGSDKSKKALSTSQEDLQKSCSLLSNLIDATMDFACQKTGKAVIEEIPFSIRCEIDLAFERFRSKQADISIITKIRNDVPDDLVGDPFRFRQVIINLVENAFELTGEGRILVSAEIIEQHEGLLKLQFNVEDTGRGLSWEEISDIMKYLDLGAAYTDTDADVYRLRLSTAKQHIELMKGQVWLTSPSTISTNPDAPGIKCSFTMEVFSGNQLKENLVFKDIRKLEEIECLILSQEKETEGERFAPLLEIGIKFKYLIYRKENTNSLIELVKEKAPNLHLIIIVNSPAEKGFQIAEELIRTEITRNLILVLLSSDHEYENYALSRNMGIEYYIEEPYEPYRFADILKNHFPGLDQEVFKKVVGPAKINQNLKVLLAEDNVFNRKVIQGLFKRLGCEIDQAKNGREAVDMVGNKEYDIVFMDLLMPEMDGIQAVTEMRKNGVEIPIMALTAVEDQEILQDALKAGFDDFLIKPASEENLRKIILQSRSQ